MDNRWRNCGALSAVEGLRQGIFKRRQPMRLKGEVEFDEVYIVAGHKGRPDKIVGRKARRNRLCEARGRGTLEKEKSPIFGMIHSSMSSKPDMSLFVFH